MRKAPLIFILLLGMRVIGLGQLDADNFIQKKNAHYHYLIKGTVRDKNYFRPIKGAIIHIVGSDGLDYYTKTDSDGHYVIDSTKLKSDQSYMIKAQANDQEYIAGEYPVNVTTMDHTVTKKTFTEDFVLRKMTPDICRFPRVNFGYNSTEITKGMKDTVLVYLVKLLNDNPTITIEIDAHASPDEGTSDIKMKLSTARAEACKAYVVSQGIDSARVKAKGWGDTETLMGCSKSDIAKMKTKQEKVTACEIDRRAEFRVLSFNYKPEEKK